MYVHVWAKAFKEYLITSDISKMISLIHEIRDAAGPEYASLLLIEFPIFIRGFEEWMMDAGLNKHTIIQILESIETTSMSSTNDEIIDIAKICNEMLFDIAEIVRSALLVACIPRWVFGRAQMDNHRKFPDIPPVEICHKLYDIMMM